VEQAGVPGDTILVPEGTYTLGLGAPLTIDSRVSVIGEAGRESTIIQAAEDPGVAGFRILVVAETGDAVVRGLTLRHGHAPGGGPVQNSGDGGGILSRGSLMLVEVAITDNSAAGFGGGIFNGAGSLIMEDAVVMANSAAANGGGIGNDAGAMMMIRSTTIQDNTARNGGGVRNLGSLTIVGSTIGENAATESFFRWWGRSVQRRPLESGELDDQRQCKCFRWGRNHHS
jgi:hypothetical protein